MTTEELNIVIRTEDGVRLSIDKWDDGGAWISMQVRGASANAVLTRAEAQRVFNALQSILEVTA